MSDKKRGTRRGSVDGDSKYTADYIAFLHSIGQAGTSHDEESDEVKFPAQENRAPEPKPQVAHGTVVRLEGTILPKSGVTTGRARSILPGPDPPSSAK